jgi:uncharacterized membrane protein
MPLTDERVERAMGTLLRVGVVTAAAVVLIGGIRYFLAQGNAPVDYRVFRGEPADLTGVGGVVRGLLRGDGRSMIQFGLLLLVATPIARVVFAIGAFAAEHDRTYVVISTIVLAALLYGLAGR